jgi:hypothetical protein
MQAVVYQHPILSRDRLAELMWAVATRRGIYRERSTPRVIEAKRPPRPERRWL